ncbi:DUF1917 domain-containing protein [Agrobacterium rubi]|nr:DUF1917 domain-containing protein [Agrobacterium rubi]NTF24886.1 DUF1917 domain-containing protein [Agrobacterium rubi]
MWNPLVSQSRFASRSRQVTDEESTGKWLVPADLGDPDLVWERIVMAAASGKLPGAKISSVHLDRILGHHLICVYCERSDTDSVEKLLTALRAMGIEGHLRYKTCKATAEGREEFLWVSADFETKQQASP